MVPTQAIPKTFRLTSIKAAKIRHLWGSVMKFWLLQYFELVLVIISINKSVLRLGLLWAANFENKNYYVVAWVAALLITFVTSLNLSLKLWS